MKPTFAVLGGGILGVATAIVWAERGYHVVFIESCAVRFHKLMDGSFFSCEQELKKAFRKVREQGNLEMTQDLSLLSTIDYVMMCISSENDVQTNVAQLWNVMEQIAIYLPKDVGLIIRSTVPIGTADKIQAWFDNQMNQHIEVISYPDFSRAGKTMEDSRNPARNILGGDENHPITMKFRRLLANHHPPIFITTRKNAEMIKYAANAFLATKISFINQIASICEELGLDIETIARGMGMDPRIGQAFLGAGIGFGGPHLPRDLSSLIFQAHEQQLEVPLLEAVRKVNQRQENWALTKLTEQLGPLQGKRIAVWGVTFKGGTEDIRHSVALSVVEEMYGQGAVLQIYDPCGLPSLLDRWEKDAIPPRGVHCFHSLEALEQADCLLILTDWQEFKEVDLFEVKKRLRFPLIIDGRNLFSPNMMKELGFKYVSVGRKV